MNQQLSAISNLVLENQQLRAECTQLKAECEQLKELKIKRIKCSKCRCYRLVTEFSYLKNGSLKKTCDVCSKPKFCDA